VVSAIRQLADRAEIIENYSEQTLRASGSMGKFFDTGHYMKKHNPSLPVGGRFYG
jgi:hypothetical protein